MTPAAKATSTRACPKAQPSDCALLSLAALPATATALKPNDDDDDDESATTSVFSVTADKITLVVPVAVPTGVTASPPKIIKAHEKPDEHPDGPMTMPPNIPAYSTETITITADADHGADPVVTAFEYTDDQKLQSAEKVMKAALKSAKKQGGNGDDRPTPTTSDKPSNPEEPTEEPTEKPTEEPTGEFSIL